MDMDLCHAVHAVVSEEASMKSATVLPFPATRRIAFIERQAEILASYRPEAAERVLEQRLVAALQAMLKRGVRPTDAEREICALERALRTQIMALATQYGDDGDAA
jgi:hypothetical protein